MVCFVFVYGFFFFFHLKCDDSFDMYSKIINRREFLKRETKKKSNNKEREECGRKRNRSHQLLFTECLVKSCGSHSFQHIYNNTTQYCYSKTKN